MQTARLQAIAHIDAQTAGSAYRAWGRGSLEKRSSGVRQERNHDLELIWVVQPVVRHDTPRRPDDPDISFIVHRLLDPVGVSSPHFPLQTARFIQQRSKTEPSTMVDNEFSQAIACQQFRAFLHEVGSHSLVRDQNPNAAIRQKPHWRLQPDIAPRACAAQ